MSISDLYSSRKHKQEICNKAIHLSLNTIDLENFITATRKVDKI
jgi:hypothetical protein